MERQNGKGENTLFYLLPFTFCLQAAFLGGLLSKVHVTKASGELKHLTPAEYAVYEKEPGDQFDYSDFHGLVDPKATGWTTGS